LSEAISSIEKANASLRGQLHVDVSRLDGERLADLMAALGNITLDTTEAGSRDVLGRVYEYFLAKFASSEGRSGGEYYTPRSVVQLLVEMVQPFAGTIYDPCCGTAGMFVQSERFLVEHGGRRDDVSIFGQESSPTTWRLAKMNLALRGIQADLGERNGDTFRSDLHPSLKADFILANPPFNARDWGAERLTTDARWRFGTPPKSSANYAWIQHIFSHLKPDGLAGFVLSNGSLSSDQGGEAQLRQRMVDADVVECIVTLPSQLFYGTQIPACLWFMSPKKTRRGAEAIAGQTLFIDARSRGQLVDRVHAELTRDEVAEIAETYHRWRTSTAKRRFVDTPGFAKSASIDEIRHHKYALVPGRYVGFARDRALKVDAAMLSAEIAEVRSRLAEIEAASTKFLAALEALTRG
jgi:type I restriction enzyme M protein